MAEDESYDQLAYNQRLKAAIHYSVGQICQDSSEDNEVVFSRQLIATLAEAVYRQCGILATDLEMFAKHAKRSVINTEDIKLAVRKSPLLFQHLNSLSQQQIAANEAEKEKKKKKKAAKKAGRETSENTDMD